MLSSINSTEIVTNPLNRRAVNAGDGDVNGVAGAESAIVASSSSTVTVKSFAREGRSCCFVVI